MLRQATSNALRGLVRAWRTAIKRVVIHAYCHGWISARTTARIFMHVNLKGA